MDRKISIETKEVTKFFGSFQALKGITADIHEGEVVVLSLIHISEPTRPRLISYAVFCLK